MSRLIYEDDVIKMLDRGWLSGKYPNTYEVHNLPTAQLEPQWIPCHDPSDLPKDKRIWITYECDVCGFVFRFVKDVYWDMTEWSDSVSGVVAYMPYIEPEPYEESGGEE